VHLADVVAILTDPGGPVLADGVDVQAQDVPAVAILTDPGGPVLVAGVNRASSLLPLRSSPTPEGRCWR